MAPLCPNLGPSLFKTMVFIRFGDPSLHWIDLTGCCIFETNTYDLKHIWLCICIAMYSKERFLSKNSAMCASTQYICTPFLVYFLFNIVIIIVDLWLIFIVLYIYVIIIIALIIIIMLFHIFIIISIIWVIIFLTFLEKKFIKYNIHRFMNELIYILLKLN